LVALLKSRGASVEKAPFALKAAWASSRDSLASKTLLDSAGIAAFAAGLNDMVTSLFYLQNQEYSQRCLILFLLKSHLTESY
jgi:hypothetical protein